MHSPRVGPRESLSSSASRTSQGLRPRALSRLSWLCSALLLLLVTPLAHAAEPVSATQEWRYRWGDSPVDPDGTPAWAKESGDTGAWRATPALTVPPGRGSHTFLWLSIPIPEGDWSDPTLFLGAVSSAVEVYAGGKRVYTSGKVNPSGREETEGDTAVHLVSLPSNAPGQRVLLRIQSSGGLIGVRQAARVGSRTELSTQLIRDGQMPFSLGVLLFGVTLAAAGMGLVRRQLRVFGALALSAAGSAGIAIGSSKLVTLVWNAPAADDMFMLLGGYYSLPGIAWFISDALLDRKRRWFHRAVMAFLTVGVLQTTVALVAPAAALSAWPIYIPYFMALLLLSISVAALEAWRGNSDARLFVAGLGCHFFGALLSSLPMVGVATPVGNVVHWGYLALVVALVCIVVRRSMLVVSALAEHTRQLEARQQDVRLLAERMGSGAGELATVVQQLRASSDEQTSGVSRQAVALQQAEVTVQEIRRTSHLTAEKASALASAAMSADSVGREGHAALERTLAHLETISGEVSEMARRILALDERTREISGIVDSVKTLADQSNMLAINAAIEAARSGEHGKGFGVVARQIRALADQSIQETQKIRDVLDGLSTNMRATAKLSEQGQQRVRLSLDEVRTSGAQLQQLAGIIGQTSASVRQITAAVTEQDAGTSQIAQAIQELSAQMQRTLKAVQETQAVSRSVQTLAESMSGVATTAMHSGSLDGPANRAA